MAPCCSASDYGRFFGRKQARRDARRYRKKGLDGVSRRLLEAAGVLDGATVLEVGGGAGTLALEALRAGAERATNVELSGEYEDEAAELVREAGLEGRVERRVGDFVAEAGAVEPADVVLMNRVVCCYPDYDALLAAAAARTRRRLVFSFPREAWWTRAGMAAINAALALSRCSFRAYVHPERRLLEAAERRGLAAAAVRRGRLWQIAVLERSV